MENRSIFEKPMTQLLKDSAQNVPIQILPDKEIEFSESMTDKELEQYIKKVNAMRR